VALSPPLDSFAGPPFRRIPIVPRRSNVLAFSSRRNRLAGPGGRVRLAAVRSGSGGLQTSPWQRPRASGAYGRPALDVRFACDSSQAAASLVPAGG
jgi:hypothetical protein